MPEGQTRVVWQFGQRPVVPEGHTCPLRAWQSGKVPNVPRGQVGCSPERRRQRLPFQTVPRGQQWPSLR